MIEEVKPDEALEQEYQKTRQFWQNVIQKETVSFHSLARDSIVMLEKYLAETGVKPSLYGSNSELSTYIWDNILYALVPHEFNERYQSLVWSIEEESLGFINRQPFGNFADYYYIFGGNYDPATFDKDKLTIKEKKALSHFEEVLQRVIYETLFQFLAGYLLAKGINLHGHYDTGREIKEGLGV